MLNISQKIKQQSGITLIETMIGLALSMVVVTSMVALMGNSLGSATRIIQMTQLSDELRNTMSMLTRDIRRANYNANAYKCYANSDCGVDGTTNQIGEVIIDDDPTDQEGNCMVYNLDRDQDGDGSSTGDGAGGFRLSTDGGIGFIEMWVGDASPAACGTAHANWVAMTDTDFVNITAFELDKLGSIEGSITEEGGGTLSQRSREIKVVIVGELILDPTIERTIEDTIRVRNDLIWNP
jgi:type II secretory pathway pseudopilin PulG